jgi:type IV secretory pathway TrbD component
VAAGTPRPGGVRAWTVLAVAFGLLSASAAFGLDVSVARQLGLVLFHVLATATVVGVARQQLTRAEVAARQPRRSGG